MPLSYDWAGSSQQVSLDPSQVSSLSKQLGLFFHISYVFYCNLIELILIRCTNWALYCTLHLHFLPI